MFGLKSPFLTYIACSQSWQMIKPYLPAWLYLIDSYQGAGCVRRNPGRFTLQTWRSRVGMMAAPPLLQLRRARAALFLCCLCCSDRRTATVIWTGPCGELHQAGGVGGWGPAAFHSEGLLYLLNKDALFRLVARKKKKTKTKHTHKQHKPVQTGSLPGEIMWCTASISRGPPFTRPCN